MRRFTAEEQETLRKNPYTLKVSESTISFTTDFKIEFWKRYQSGSGPARIFRELGYDVLLLGPKRIEGTAARIRKQASSPSGFQNKSLSLSNSSLKYRNYESMPPEKAIHHIQNELSYLRQELAFVKKIIQAESINKRAK